MPKKKQCDHGGGDAMHCTRRSPCFAHSHKCRICGYESPVGEPVNRFHPWNAKR